MHIFTALLTLVLLLPVTSARAAGEESIEVILTSKILQIKDNRTLQPQILKGNKARVFSKVSVHAKGFANRGLKQWFEKALPGAIEGFYEREDKDTGLSVRFKPVLFLVKKREIFCTAAATPEYEVCHADFAVSVANAVDVPAGEGGEHAITLQILPPTNDLKPKIAKAVAVPYLVLSGDPALTRFSFTGLAEH